MLDFQRRCRARLERLGDIAMSRGDCDEAVENFSAAVSLTCNPEDRINIIMKRNRARGSMMLWGD